MIPGDCQHGAAELLSFLDIRRESLVAILNFYSDESGKFSDKKVVSFSGFCASPTALEKFEDRWRELLRRYKLPYLTMKEALQAERQLSPVIPQQSPKERIEALKPFAAALVETFELGVSITVAVDAFARTKEHVKNQLSGGSNPTYFCFLTEMLQVADHGQEDDRISLICDDDEQTAINYLKLYRKLKNVHEPAHQKFCSITFADDKVFLPLQAADMLASLTRLQSGSEFFGTTYDYQPLFYYLAEPRGPKYIRWRIAFIGEVKMARLELDWKPPHSEGVVNCFV
jgi:hypothetical protein